MEGNFNCEGSVAYKARLDMKFHKNILCQTHAFLETSGVVLLLKYLTVLTSYSFRLF